MDTDTATVRSFESEMIPGLLQTGDHARRVHAVTAHLVTPDELNRFMAARKRRQSLLTDDEAGRVRLIATNETPHPARAGGAVLIEAGPAMFHRFAWSQFWSSSTNPAGNACVSTSIAT